jgi:hypothetical protein
MPFGSAEGRKELGRLVLSVAAVYALALAAYFAFGIATASPRVRMVFSVGWSLATLGAVAVPLRRIRALRNAALRGGSETRGTK